MKKPFWRYRLMGRAQNFETWWAESGLAHKALEEGRTLHKLHRTGSLKEGATFDELLKLASAHSRGITFFEHKASSLDVFLTSDDHLVNLAFETGNRSLTFTVLTLDGEHLRRMRGLIDSHLVKLATRGRIYIVISTAQGPELRELGVAGEAFEEGNYRPEVVREYRHVVGDLGAESPCGRIVILDGPPGTGKTHMVRALLNDVPKSTFVLVPAGLISQVAAPGFVHALLEEQQRGHPMVLVIEDADECLSSRKADNLSEISALLNLSDGIFGALLDLRIVATTNVELDDLDPAVMRDGRLCRRIEVAKLDSAQANAVYGRLTGKADTPFSSGYHTLAEAYRAARGSGGGIVQAPRRRVGFVHEPAEPTPAEEMGLRPGDVVETDDGTLARVRTDGQLEILDDDEE